jgi:predicted nucleic acid-binding protein
VKVLIDTNVILDFLLERDPFQQDAEALFEAIAAGQVIGYVTATTLTDIFYISRRHTGSIDLAREAVLTTLDTTIICPVNRIILESALAFGIADFEDAVQIACAIDQGLEVICTRDMKGFLSSTIPVLSVRQLLEQLKNAES